MDIWYTLFYFALAFVLYGLLTTIYRTNPVYDAIEGIGIGAAVGSLLWNNINNFNTQLWRPITTNFNANWFLIFAIILGAANFFVYVRRYVEIFRFAAIISLAISIATTVRTNTAVFWQMVWYSAQMQQDIMYIFVWITFIGGMFYFLYSKKLDKPLSVPREIGRWFLVFELGALLTPLFFRGTEAMLGWTLRINSSPAWMVPYLIFAGVALDALNSKYKFLSRGKTVTATQ